MWEDDQNNEKRLWYLSENSEKYLERNSYRAHNIELVVNTFWFFDFTAAIYIIKEVCW